MKPDSADASVAGISAAGAATAVVLQDKAEIESLLRQDPWLHIYALGDLDDFFWPYTTWYTAAGTREPANTDRPVVLLYRGPVTESVLALSPENGVAHLRELVSAVAERLPDRFDAHLSPGVAEALDLTHQPTCPIEHARMGLLDWGRIASIPTDETVAFTPGDAAELQRFYDRCYPGNWFDARMLETGHYFGVRDSDGTVVSAAGVHVVSGRYRVAALGNIATAESHRNRGLARLVTAQVCQSLHGLVDHIGLNVATANGAAIAAYGALGFQTIATFTEWSVTRRATGSRVASPRR